VTSATDVFLFFCCLLGFSWRWGRRRRRGGGVAAAAARRLPAAAVGRRGRRWRRGDRWFCLAWALAPRACAPPVVWFVRLWGCRCCASGWCGAAPLVCWTARLPRRCALSVWGRPGGAFCWGGAASVVCFLPLLCSLLVWGCLCCLSGECEAAPLLCRSVGLVAFVCAPPRHSAVPPVCVSHAHSKRRRRRRLAPIPAGLCGRRRPWRPVVRTPAPARRAPRVRAAV